MFGRKTKTANDSFLIAKANMLHDKKGGMGVAVKNEPRPPMAKKKPMTVQTKNPHPASNRRNLGAMGKAKTGNV